MTARIGAWLALSVTLSGCSGSSGDTPNRLELQIERAQFAVVTDGLRSAHDAVVREVRASRAVWLAIAKGLPTSPSADLRKGATNASESARQLTQPSFMDNAHALTGPAAGLAGLYEEFARLAERGWRLTQASIEWIAGGAPSLARYARINSSLYIDAIYDAHFDLSLAGKSIVDGYRRLGGARALGEKLSPTEIGSLARAYSIAAIRLTPHPTAR